MRVVISNGRAAIRARLRILLEGQPYVEVVGEAGDTAEVLTQVCTLEPDVVLLDIAMGGNAGLRTQEKIYRIAPETKVLLLGIFPNLAFVRTVMAAGTAGCLSENAADTELLKAMRVIRAGKRYIDSRLSEELFPGGRDDGPVLSQREGQVLLLTASGHSYREIADQMQISVKTVETYRARIVKKLGTKSRAELVQYAIDSGLLSRNTI